MLIAVATLVVAGAAPAFAAPGGEHGAPEGHGHATEKPDMDDMVGEMPDMEAPPEWAKAYGWRIKNATGMTYGHIRICTTGNENARSEDKCAGLDGEWAEDFEFPEDMRGLGAGGFWVLLDGHLAG